MLLALRSLWERGVTPPTPSTTATQPPSVSMGFPAIGGTPKRRPRKRPVMPGPGRPMYWEEDERLRLDQEEEEILALLGIDFD
jgi:hypothetical protein